MPYSFIVYDLKPNNTTRATNGEESEITLGLCGIREAQSLVLWTIVCLLVFVFHLTIVYSVFRRFTRSDERIGI